MRLAHGVLEVGCHSGWSWAIGQTRWERAHLLPLLSHAVLLYAFDNYLFALKFRFFLVDKEGHGSSYLAGCHELNDSVCVGEHTK